MKNTYMPLDNPILLFESNLKNFQKFLFQLGPYEDAALKIKEAFDEMLKSYQALKKEVSRMERSEKEKETLLEVGKAINSVLDMDELLVMIMDMAIEAVGAERGFIMLKDNETGELVFKVARNMERELNDKTMFAISSGIISRVARDGNAIFFHDSQADGRFSCREDVMDHNPWSLMCVPLKTKDELIGIIYVDNRMVAGMFTEKTVDFLSAIANQAAISIENARLYENVVNEMKIRTNLQLHLSPRIVKEIIARKEKLVLGGRRLECSVLFANICDFTSFSEKLSPDATLKILNEYFSAMAEIICKNDGTLDKFMGDTIMALFGSPVFNRYNARNAVKAGLDMLKKLGELQKKWESEGNPYFEVRIGISTGEVIAGNIGSQDKMDYTVIGSNASLAARLESNAMPMTVRISDSTYIKIKDMIVANETEPVLVKGKSVPVKTYEVISIRITEVEKIKSERRFVRKEVSIFATFRSPPSVKINQCIIQNISAGGLLISSRVDVPVGERILLDFNLPNDNVFNNIEGKVVQSRPFKDDLSCTYFKIGIEFISLSKGNAEIIYNFTAIP